MDGGKLYARLKKQGGRASDAADGRQVVPGVPHRPLVRPPRAPAVDLERRRQLRIGGADVDTVQPRRRQADDDLVLTDEKAERPCPDGQRDRHRRVEVHTP